MTAAWDFFTGIPWFIYAVTAPMLGLMGGMWWLHRRSRDAQRRYREASAEERRMMDQAMDADPVRSAMERPLSLGSVIVSIAILILIRWLTART